MSKELLEISIERLKLRTIIGFQKWERTKVQDVVISISFRFDATAAIESDDVDDAIDYKVMTKKIISAVEASSFNLLESLVHMVYKVVCDTSGVVSACVVAEKPGALRFCDTVSAKICDYE